MQTQDPREAPGAGDDFEAVLRAKTRSPKPQALDAARSAAKLAKTTAPVRWRFLERTAAADPAPAMAQVLRGDRGGRRAGGRGGEVRLKLLLSMLWLVRDNPAPVLTAPSRAWASLLGLDDPTGRGSRRINDAISWLEDGGFLIKDTTGDRVIQLLNETGNRQPYELPGAAIRRLPPRDPRRTDHLYLQLPSGLWTNGWLSLLSGAAVAMLLLLYRLQADNPEGTLLWFGGQDAKLRFDLSDDTRSKGLRELTMAGLVNVERKAVDPASFEPERVRNVYALQRDRLNKPARILNDYQYSDWWEAAAAATT
ncbi:hypothetical protein [Micromonospora tulbaghiae]|nr:hypothetical protein [Micromonospora tulbaghiae]